MTGSLASCCHGHPEPLATARRNVFQAIGYPPAFATSRGNLSLWSNFELQTAYCDLSLADNSGPVGLIRSYRSLPCVAPRRQITLEHREETMKLLLLLTLVGLAFGFAGPALDAGIIVE